MKKGLLCFSQMMPFQISDIIFQGKVTFSLAVGLWVMSAKKTRPPTWYLPPLLLKGHTTSCIITAYALFKE